MLLTQQYNRNQAFGDSFSLVFEPCHASFFMVFALHPQEVCYRPQQPELSP